MSQEKLWFEGRRWLDQARDDLEAAELLRESGKYAQACFFAQQCGEKSLKAVWRILDRESIGHSITRLITSLPSGREREMLERHLDDAKLLDRHYIPTRYPDALPDLTPRDAFGLTDATEAIRAAGGILVTVEELLQR
jgi:HEPN domain-containing protein